MLRVSIITEVPRASAFAGRLQPLMAPRPTFEREAHVQITRSLSAATTMKCLLWFVSTVRVAMRANGVSRVVVGGRTGGGDEGGGRRRGTGRLAQSLANDQASDDSSTSDESCAMSSVVFVRACSLRGVSSRVVSVVGAVGRPASCSCSRPHTAAASPRPPRIGWSCLELGEPGLGELSPGKDGQGEHKGTIRRMEGIQTHYKHSSACPLPCSTFAVHFKSGPTRTVDMQTAGRQTDTSSRPQQSARRQVPPSRPHPCRRE